MFAANLLEIVYCGIFTLKFPTEKNETYLRKITLIQNRYLIVHLIGKGGMGRGLSRCGSKAWERGRAGNAHFFAGDEIAQYRRLNAKPGFLASRCGHPVLPKVSDHFSEGDEQYLVMEHISGGRPGETVECCSEAVST
jgi:hypothetical protein